MQKLLVFSIIYVILDATNKGYNMNKDQANTTQDKIEAQRVLIVGSHYNLHFSDKAHGVTVFIQPYQSGQRVFLKAFSGRRLKPDFFHLFNTLEGAAAFQAQWYSKICEAANAKQARKAAQKASPNPLAVGDVLVASWGYDQTNYNYYQVLRLVGTQSVEIQELKTSRDYNGASMSGDCVPLKNQFIDKPMVKRVNESGAVKVFSFGVWASKKESIKSGEIELFKPDHYTAYA
jgi:hypothetical protein